ncbi:biotin transporter BioY [Pseudoroseicyclus aestuarii]|uniref:Biotin transporter n=1 Tax=Pseudoroseicyclus aestuarii TaxID=1795041 RepID=A0A318SZN6_9RHOB|nr:biotin transporter BioY [Pseudoroseicyclus aestuarii]PYE85839.1 biotin transport system substrate-specific component [Pseudoroseicyclus aestuarii]
MRTTLTAAALPRSLPVQTLMVLGGSLAIAVAAQISVPMIPVPMTLQTLAILVVGLTYGARLGGATLLAYLAEGALGLPVFSNGGAGLAYMAGPTGGFLLGFALMAWLAGLLAENGLGRGTLRLTLAALVPAAVLYLPGIAWLTVLTPLDLSGAFTAGAAPFLIGDAVKAVLAAMIVSGGWAALKHR